MLANSTFQELAKYFSEFKACLRIAKDAPAHSMELLKLYIPYSGKVWRGESLANLANRLRFAKLKPSKLVVTIDNPLADLFIRQTFFRQTLEKSRFAKHSARQTFPLYSIMMHAQE